MIMVTLRRAVRTQLVRILFRMVLLVWAVATLTFFLLRLAPGDPAMNIVGDTAPPEQLAQVRRSFGLDKPLWDQYLRYMWHLLQGDLGTSFVWQEPAVHVVLRQLPYTVLLALVSISVLAVVASALGLVAGWVGGRIRDLISTIVLTLQSLPDFWVAVMLVLIFSVSLHVFPTGGYSGPLSLVLPASTIVLYQLGAVTRVAAYETHRVATEPFVLAMSSRGVSRARIAMHVIRNISLPIVTMLGVRLAGLLNGVVIVEAVFSWPGIGGTAVRALQARDYPLLQATVIISTVLVLSLSSIVDIAYTYLDPRLRVTRTVAA